jgi:hypothetical protein
MQTDNQASMPYSLDHSIHSHFHPQPISDPLAKIDTSVTTAAIARFEVKKLPESITQIYSGAAFTWCP